MMPRGSRIPRASKAGHAASPRTVAQSECIQPAESLCICEDVLALRREFEVQLTAFRQILECLQDASWRLSEQMLRAGYAGTKPCTYTIKTL